MKHLTFIANWKMHKTLQESLAYFDSFQSLVKPSLFEHTTLVLCPSFLALSSLSQTLAHSSFKDRLFLGAQGMHYAEQGAYTSQISARMLQGLCSYVLIGHSETRAFETSESLRLKLKQALTYGLKPVLCIGETFEQHERHVTQEALQDQLQDALEDIEHLEGLHIAYEPVWAIQGSGNGIPAHPDSVNHVHAFIQEFLTTRYGYDEVMRIPLLYGGSVSAQNVASFVSQKYIHGALIGSASLDSASFSHLIMNARSHSL